MAASSWNAKQPRIVPRESGIPEIIFVPEAASQSFKAGTPVKLSSNTLVIATDSTTGFLGIAMQDATGVTSSEIPVQLANPDSCYVLARVTNNGTDALASTLATGQSYDWYADSDSVFYADANDTSGGTLTFVSELKDASGTSTYWGRFRVLAGQAGNIDEDGA